MWGKYVFGLVSSWVDARQARWRASSYSPFGFPALLPSLPALPPSPHTSPLPSPPLYSLSTWSSPTSSCSCQLPPFFQGCHVWDLDQTWEWAGDPATMSPGPSPHPTTLFQDSHPVSDSSCSIKGPLINGWTISSWRKTRMKPNMKVLEGHKATRWPTCTTLPSIHKWKLWMLQFDSWMCEMLKES